ncbi:MAG: hypothetical protein HQM10_03800 [Candidatus Riflebacteria bacterium]|nr:hypothetical protein [Candidatus Riflebacteria bacterium]
MKKTDDYKKVKTTQIALRLPSDFHKQLKKDAEANCRSLHAHVMFLLYAAQPQIQEKPSTENEENVSLSRQSQPASGEIRDQI